MIEITTKSSISVKAERPPARAIERRVCRRLDFIIVSNPRGKFLCCCHVPRSKRCVARPKLAAACAATESLPRRARPAESLPRKRGPLNPATLYAADWILPPKEAAEFVFDAGEGPRRAANLFRSMMNLPLSLSSRKRQRHCQESGMVTSPLCRLPPRIRDRNPWPKSS